MGLTSLSQSSERPFPKKTGADALCSWGYAENGRFKFLAMTIGVSVAAVSYWANGIARVPPGRCKSIERVTGIPRHVLRPDIFDAPIEKGPTP